MRGGGGWGREKVRSNGIRLKIVRECWPRCYLFLLRGIHPCLSLGSTMRNVCLCGPRARSFGYCCCSYIGRYAASNTAAHSGEYPLPGDRVKYKNTLYYTFVFITSRCSRPRSSASPFQTNFRIDLRKKNTPVSVDVFI